MKFFVVLALIAVASAGVIKPTQLSDEIQQIVAAINSPSTDPATAAALEQMLQDYLGVAVGPAIVDQHPISVGPAIVEQQPISVGPAIVGAGDIAVGPAIIDFPIPDGGAVSAPIVVGPVVDQHPISVGPAIVDFPLPDGGAVTGPVDVAPVVVGPASTPESSSPLVQIIVNVQAPAGPQPTPVAVGPVSQLPQFVDEADNSVQGVAPVQVVDATPVVVVDPVQVVDTPSVVGIGPVQVVDLAPIVAIDPVQVVDLAPIVAIDPVQVVDVAPIVIEPVQVGTPILPSPAITLPEDLN